MKPFAKECMTRKYSIRAARVGLGILVGITGQFVCSLSFADGSAAAQSFLPALAAMSPSAVGAPTVIPISVFGEQNSLLASQASGVAESPGVSMLLYSPSSTSSSSSSSAATPFTYGLVDNMTLRGPKGAGSDAGFSLKGMFVASSDLASGVGAQSASGQQAVDQTLSYKAGILAFSARMINVGRGFSGSTGLGNALASGNAMSASDAKSIAGFAGQNEQSISLALGAEKTGQVSVSTDQVRNSLSNKSTGSTSVGFKYGSDHSMRFAFLDNTVVDNIAHTSTNTQSMSIGQTIMRLLNLSFSHSVNRVASGAPSTATVVDQVEMALSGKQATSLDMKGQMTHDSLGGYDRVFGVDAKRMALGATIGLHLGDESRQADAGASSAYSINTLGYTFDKQYNKLASFDTSWLATTDRSRPVGQQRSVVASSKFSLTPISNLSILNLFTTNNGADNSSLATTFAFPKDSMFSGTKVDATVAQNTSPSAASTNTRRVSVDTTFARIRNFLQIASVSDVHFEMDQTNTDAWGTNPAMGYNAAAIKLAGALAAFKDSHWSYAFVERAQATSNASAVNMPPVPDSRAIDLTLPYRGVTLKMYDHDQLPQSNGTYQDIKEMHIELAGALIRAITGSMMYSASTDATGAFLTRRRAYGFDFAGKPGLFPLVELGLTRQIESELGNGDQYGMVYRLGYTFQPPDSDQKVTVACNIATNTFDNRTGAKDSVDATVHCDYAVKY